MIFTNASRSVISWWPSRCACLTFEIQISAFSDRLHRLQEQTCWPGGTLTSVAVMPQLCCLTQLPQAASAAFATHFSSQHPWAFSQLHSQLPNNTAQSDQVCMWCDPTGHAAITISTKASFLPELSHLILDSCISIWVSWGRGCAPSGSNSYSLVQCNNIRVFSPVICQRVQQETNTKCTQTHQECLRIHMNIHTSGIFEFLSPFPSHWHRNSTGSRSTRCRTTSRCSVMDEQCGAVHCQHSSHTSVSHCTLQFGALLKYLQMGHCTSERKNSNEICKRFSKMQK